VERGIHTMTPKFKKPVRPQRVLGKLGGKKRGGGQGVVGIPKQTTGGWALVRFRGRKWGKTPRWKGDNGRGEHTGGRGTKS